MMVDVFLLFSLAPSILKLDVFHLLPGSNSLASSPLEKPQPIGTKIMGRQEFLQQYDPRDQKTAYSLEHKLFDQERHPNLAPSSWRLDQDPSCQSDSSLKAAALFHDVRRTNTNGVYNENGLFSSSLSDIFDKKCEPFFFMISMCFSQVCGSTEQ
jgi:hypothetical protein